MTKKNRVNHCFLVLILPSVMALSVSCKKSAPSGSNTVVDTVAVPKDTVPSLATVHSWLIDKNATDQTAALFYNLKKLAKTNILFGHQDDTKRGVTDANTQW